MQNLPKLTTLALAAALALSAATPALAQEGPVGTNGGPDIQDQGCVYYEHANFAGASNFIAAGTRRKLGGGWDDKISSIACNVHCHVVVYEYREFNGAWADWGANISYVGDNWNDDISSLIARCDR